MSEHATTVVGLIFIAVWAVAAVAGLCWTCIHGDGFEERDEIR